MRLLLGDSLEVLKSIPDNSIDALLTDPPAGISFMGKSWDEDKGGRDSWIAWLESIMRECLRVMKPGAHGLVWALPRTSHWTGFALENAGFRIKDRVSHLYGVGFPKSTNLGKQADKTGILCQCDDDENIETTSDMSKLPKTISTKEQNSSEQSEILQQHMQRCSQGLESKVCCSPTGDCTQRPCRMDGDFQENILAKNEWAEKSGMEGRSLYRAEQGVCNDSQADASSGEKKRLCVGAYSSDGESLRTEIKVERGDSSYQSQSTGQSTGEFNSIQRSQNSLGETSQSGLHCRKCGKLKKETHGWGSHLKPACEDYWLIQKPIEAGLTISKNVLKWGTGAINIDGCRIGVAKEDPNHRKPSVNWKPANKPSGINFVSDGRPIANLNTQGRFPANLLFSHSPYCTDEICDIECSIRKINTQAGSDVARFFYTCGLKNIKDDVTFAGKIPENINKNSNTDGFGSAKTGQYLMGTISITKTGTRSIIIFPIFSAYTKMFIGNCTIETEKIINKSLDENVESVSVVSNTEVLINFTQGHLEPITGIVNVALENIHEVGEKKIGSIGTTITANTDPVNRFFYCSKVSPSERNAGLDGFEKKIGTQRMNASLERHENGREATARAPQSLNQNHHPTVKAQKLMRYFAKLITPPNGTILDCFMGSGSTGLAAKSEGFDFIGIEKEPEYFEIAKARINPI